MADQDDETLFGDDWLMAWNAHPEMTLSALRVMIIYAFYGRSELIAWPGSPTVAKHCGMDRRHVKRAVDILLRIGCLIELPKRKQGRVYCSCYRLAFPSDDVPPQEHRKDEEIAQNNADDVPHDAPHGVPDDVPHDVPLEAHEPKPYTEPETEPGKGRACARELDTPSAELCTVASAPPLASDDFQNWFDKLWELVDGMPLHVDRPRALGTFLRIMRSADEPEALYREIGSQLGKLKILDGLGSLPKRADKSLHWWLTDEGWKDHVDDSAIRRYREERQDEVERAQREDAERLKQEQWDALPDEIKATPENTSVWWLDFVTAANGGRRPTKTQEEQQKPLVRQAIARWAARSDDRDEAACWRLLQVLRATTERHGPVDPVAWIDADPHCKLVPGTDPEARDWQPVPIPMEKSA